MHEPPETMAACDHGVRVCGNGVIDPGESCDGEATRMGSGSIAGCSGARGVATPAVGADRWSLLTRLGGTAEGDKSPLQRRYRQFTT